MYLNYGQVIGTKNTIKLFRDCKAKIIPVGDVVVLKEGQEVAITQNLGGNYTITSYGNMFLIKAEDADALGKEVVEEETKEVYEKIDKELIWDCLRTCYDPEIPINIVDLGLIYDLNVSEDSVSIKMTLTAPGCGMGGSISSEVKEKIEAVVKDNVKVDIELVWEPYWNQAMMSEEAKLVVGIL